MGSIGQATQAGLWGLFAALSLPLGATVGLLASPISQRTVAACMAFGAGALIFAIAIELYGEAVTDLRLGNQGRFELIGLALSTVVGALIYTAIDRFILHRPTVSLNSLSRFGLSGPRPSPRTEWLAADAEREVIDGETAPLLGPASARRDSVQSVDDVEGGDQPPGTRTAASERSFAIILWFASWLDTLPQAILIGLLTGERRVHVSFVLAAFLANFPQSLGAPLAAPPPRAGGLGWL
jgi:zinc transporter ZupT